MVPAGFPVFLPLRPDPAPGHKARQASRCQQRGKGPGASLASLWQKKLPIYWLPFSLGYGYGRYRLACIYCHGVARLLAIIQPIGANYILVILVGGGRSSQNIPAIRIPRRI